MASYHFRRWLMRLTSEGWLAIGDLVASHGQLFDDGELDRLDELFTADVVYDASDFGQEPMNGIAAIRSAALALGDRNPVAHHVTNIVIKPVDGDTASVRSKGSGVTSDAKIGSVTYIDAVIRTATGWRISHRRFQARRQPLSGLGTKPELLQ
ncbi:MAG: nuclear transport factor 2 family protein [Marmoricola sp.]